MSLNDNIAKIAAAKLVLESMGFDEKSMLSPIFQAQKQLRQIIAEATAQSKIVDFLSKISH